MLSVDLLHEPLWIVALGSIFSLLVMRSSSEKLVTQHDSKVDLSNHCRARMNAEDDDIYFLQVSSNRQSFLKSEGMKIWPYGI